MWASSPAVSLPSRSSSRSSWTKDEAPTIATSERCAAISAAAQVGGVSGGLLDDEALGEAPGDDGSYGPNEDGIFFFATDGTKITWNGLYQQTDRVDFVRKSEIVDEPGETGTDEAGAK